MSVTLLAFNHPINVRLTKLVITAKLAGVQYTVQHLNIGVDHLTEEYLNNVHPMGLMSALQTEEGYVFESNACLRALARMDKTNSFLYGRTAFENAQVDSWLDYCLTEIDDTCQKYLGKGVFNATLTEEQLKACQVQVDAALAGAERWLEIRTFLVGERLTIADINLACMCDWIFRYSPEGHEALAKKFKNVFRHYYTVMYQPKIVEILLSIGAPVGLPKTEKKKEEPKPKAEKKKEEKPADADDDMEDELVEEKKKPNPLDLLPPSKFVLDAFKREYSNKDTRKEAAPFLFDNFDNEGFSAFWCRYKYNDELSKSFMTGNLVRGWFQRMDHTRKYAFACVMICGTEEKHEITGLWIFRGKGLPEIVTEVDDCDLYEWKMIPDIKAEAAKITDYLAWDGETFATNPVLEGRVFK